MPRPLRGPGANCQGARGHRQHRLPSDQRSSWLERRAARVHASGGATNLTFDEQHRGAIGSEVNLQRPDYDDVANRYDIGVTGGANNLTIDEK